MESRTTRSFREALKALPREIRKLARAGFRIFQQNSSHPSLRMKLVCHDPRIFSVRVGISYRALGEVQNGVIHWFWIGTHAEYDHLLTQL